MPVQSVELRNGQPVKERTRVDVPILLGKIGVWLAISAFGGVFWAIDGGFSVIGLGVIASSFNDAGRIAWAGLTALTFQVPVQVPGLPTTQPLVPWLGVVAASLLQICVIYMRLRGRTIPLWMWIAAIVLSLYDIGTTFFGLGTVAWIARSGMIIQGSITVILTFIVEITIGVMLRK